MVTHTQAAGQLTAALARLVFDNPHLQASFSRSYQVRPTVHVGARQERQTGARE